ncbi:hypothetical protein FQN54_001616 [Arachnomyces sp. PD_36]|nr:hypothetical protein FQN54_001616 [Arachnomyces sp. PD_36]
MCTPWPWTKSPRKGKGPASKWFSRPKQPEPPVPVWDSTPDDRLSPVALHRFLAGKFGNRSFSIEIYDDRYSFTVPRRLTKTEQRELSTFRAPAPAAKKTPVLAWMGRGSPKKRSDKKDPKGKGKGKASPAYPMLARNEPNWGKYNSFT